MQVYALLVVACETYYFWSVLVKPMAPIVGASVLAQEKGSHLNSIFMLGHCVDKRLALEVKLRYGTCKFVQIPIFWWQSSGMFLVKNDTLSEIRHLEFIPFW